MRRPDASLEEEYKTFSTKCVLQSGETVLSGSEMAEVTQTAVVEFLDETPGSSWKVEQPMCTNLVDQQPQTELAKYLSRPVLIKTHVWAQTDTNGVKATWNPWELFLNSAPIRNKITNYGLINCTLKLKFVINASPFYSGAMAFTYMPLQGLTSSTIIADTGGGELMGHSQRPKVWVFPQTNQGGEIELPFFYHKNWLDLTSLVEAQNMGTITPCVYAQLVSANGVTGTSVLVNVYAWAENVKLHAPTIAAALQADEYDTKPSQIASSVAKATGALSRVPLIGPYMRATSMIASGVSSVASSLGFTNVPNIDKVAMYKPAPFPQNSSCEISVPTERSSVDPKNEVTLDPRTVGLDGKDELDIVNIASRECWLGNAILSSDDAVDFLTLVSRVTPALMYQFDSVSPKQYTPMGYLTELFAFWRGDIIFRFKFICTRFHKGRVRITFDPQGQISTVVPDYTTVFNEVLDIGAEQDVEVRVPYMKARTYLRSALVSGNYNLSGGALTNIDTANGLISMRVVNPLTGPVSPTAIPVMVFVRAADNIEYAGPRRTLEATKTLSPYALQSQEMVYGVSPKQVIAGNKVIDGDPNRTLVHFGESIKSLRPLIHRLTFQYTMQTNEVAAANTINIFSLYQSRRLKYAGFDPNGIFSGTKVVGVGFAPYNYVRMNVQQLVSLLFIGQRGSMTWSYNLESSITTPPSNVSLKRYHGPITTSSYIVNDTSTTISHHEIAKLYNTLYLDQNSGVALTDQRNQPGITMNFPYYSQYNFQLTNPLNATLGAAEDGTDLDNVILQIVTQKVSASGFRMRSNAWAACGPDYNFFFFINTPSLYEFSIPVGA